jgi:hypothetical protein
MCVTLTADLVHEGYDVSLLCDWWVESGVLHEDFSGSADREWRGEIHQSEVELAHEQMSQWTTDVDDVWLSVVERVRGAEATPDPRRMEPVGSARLRPERGWWRSRC